MSNISGLSEVVKSLYKLQCCARCVLRYIGIGGAGLYAKPYEVCAISSSLDDVLILELLKLFLYGEIKKVDCYQRVDTTKRDRLIGKSVRPKSRYYKERQVDRKKRKAIRW